MKQVNKKEPQTQFSFLPIENRVDTQADGEIEIQSNRNNGTNRNNHSNDTNDGSIRTTEVQSARKNNYTGQGFREIDNTIKIEETTRVKSKIKKSREQTIGYVPIQVINLALEEK